MIKRPLTIACIGYIIGIILGLYFEKTSIVLFFILILISIILKNCLNKTQKRYARVIIPKNAIIIFLIAIILGWNYLILLI